MQEYTLLSIKFFWNVYHVGRETTYDQQKGILVQSVGQKTLYGMLQ